MAQPLASGLCWLHELFSMDVDPRSKPHLPTVSVNTAEQRAHAFDNHTAARAWSANFAGAA